MFYYKNNANELSVLSCALMLFEIIYDTMKNKIVFWLLSLIFVATYANKNLFIDDLSDGINQLAVSSQIDSNLSYTDEISSESCPSIVQDEIFNEELPEVASEIEDIFANDDGFELLKQIVPFKHSGQIEIREANFGYLNSGARENVTYKLQNRFKNVITHGRIKVDESVLDSGQEVVREVDDSFKTKCFNCFLGQQQHYPRALGVHYACRWDYHRHLKKLYSDDEKIREAVKAIKGELGIDASKKNNYVKINTKHIKNVVDREGFEETQALEYIIKTVNGYTSNYVEGYEGDILELDCRF